MIYYLLQMNDKLSMSNWNVRRSKNIVPIMGGGGEKILSLPHFYIGGSSLPFQFETNFSIWSKSFVRSEINYALLTEIFETLWCNVKWIFNTIWSKITYLKQKFCVIWSKKIVWSEAIYVIWSEKSAIWNKISMQS